MSDKPNAGFRDVSAVSHDGKVIIVAAENDGDLWYTVRQSGFEDTTHDPSLTQDLPGFENWRKVPLGLATDDPTVRTHEASALVTGTGSPLTRSRFDAAASRSVPARVKLASVLDHLYLFRVSSDGKLLLDRFVLDGLTNELVPKLEVRFRRSGQRLEPEGGTKAAGGPTTDSLGYRSVDQQPFYEPTQELSFLGSFDPSKPWFSVEALATAEHGRHRWNFFVYADPAHPGPTPAVADLQPELRLVSVAASAEGLLDLRDQTKLQPDPDNPNRRVPRTVPGIVDRAIRLDGRVALGFDSSVYHNQVERRTKSGPQLMKENTRVMLSVPIEQPDRDAPVVAAISFAVDSLGQLAQIDRAADSDEVLSGDVKQVLLPLTDLEDITLIADQNPPPQGKVLGIAQSQDERVQITSDVDADEVLRTGQQVRVTGTRSYDGIYQASAVDGGTFVIDAVFDQAEDVQGHWEVVEDDDSGLVFENMIANYERTADGGLKISCLSHNIEVGDEIRISGSVDHDGDYPITKVNEDNSFELDRLWPTGEVVNLSRRPRRGLYFDGNGDYLHVPTIETAPHTPTGRLQRTITAWVQLSELTDEPQTVFATGSDLVHLFIDGEGKLVMNVGFADGHRASVVDTAALPANQWTHVTAMFDYRGDLDGSTTLTLGRGGRASATAVVAPRKPLHLPLRNLKLTGDQLTVATMQHRLPLPTDITLEAWVSTGQRGRGVVASWYRNGPFILALTGDGNRRVVEWTTGSDVMTGTVHLPNDDWHHIAVTRETDGTKSIYVNGQLDSAAKSPRATKLAEASAARAVATASDTKRPLWLGFLGAAATESKATGHNANSATYAGGSYVQTSIREWEQHGADGSVIETFSEIARTDSSVHLRSADNSYRLELDFIAGRVSRRDFDVRVEIGRISDVVPINGINVIDVTCEWGRWRRHHETENREAPSYWTLHRPDGTTDDMWSQSRSGSNLRKDSLVLERWVSSTRERGESYRVTINLDSNDVVVERSWYVNPKPRQQMRTVYPITALGRTPRIYQTHDGWYAREISTDHGRYEQVIGTTTWRFTGSDGIVSDQVFDEVDRSKRKKWMSLQPRGADHMLEFETRSVRAGVAKRVVNRIEASQTSDVHAITAATVHSEDPDPADRFDGFLADVRVWNKARSAAVIAEGRSDALTGTERNLVAHWPLGESSARQLADATKNKAHATQPDDSGARWFAEPHRAPGERAHFEGDGYEESVSMAAVVDQRARHVLELDGVDGHLKIGPLSEDLSGGYTIAAWARWDRFGYWSRIVDFGSGPYEDNIVLANRGRDDHLALWTPNGEVYAEGVLRLGKWVHVAATVAADGSTVLYLDGAVVGSGNVGVPVTARRTSNFIGRSNWSSEPNFQGGLRDVQFWSRPLTAAEVRRYGNAAPRGHEDGLLHHWSMRTANVKGKRRVVDDGLSTARPAELVGGAVAEQQDRRLPPVALTELRGKLSDVQYWDVNRSMDGVRAAMHDRLTGNEYGLVGSWRCGGILADADDRTGTRLTPDFGPDGLDAVVNGDTYVSAALLPRRNTVGRAVRYSNDDLVAVSQGGRYRESFEFQAERDDRSALTLDELHDADERGNPVFRISYWGQSSRTSTERTKFTPDERLDFIDLGDGWFRAEAIVTVPEGVNMIRAFEVSDVRGLWVDGDEPPDREWLHLAIRKHRLELISDSVSRRNYTDLMELPVLADDAAHLEAEMKDIPGLERRASALRLELDRLHDQMAMFVDRTNYEAERENLRVAVPRLATEAQQAAQAVDTFVGDPLNERFHLLNVVLPQYLTASGTSVFVATGFGNASMWEFVPTGAPGQHAIVSVTTGKRLVVTKHGDPLYLGTGTDNHHRWQVDLHHGGRVVTLRNIATEGFACPVGHVAQSHLTTIKQLWGGSLFLLQSTGTKRRGYDADLRALKRDRDRIKADQVAKSERLTWLESILADTSPAAERAVRTRAASLVGEIQSIEIAIARRHGEYVRAAQQLAGEPQTMGLVAEDPRGLKTYGAILGFASPIGPVTSAATAEGNVQLTYFDADGRFRATDYDATSDSVNGTYEQWVPSTIAVAPDLSRPTDAVTLDSTSPIELGAGVRTIEAWFYYPLPADDQGRPYPLCYLTSDRDGTEATIAVAGNRRLGTVADGFFHDGGVELADEVTPGWHHLAAVTSGEATTYFLDGESVGHTAEVQRSINRAALVFDETGHVDVGSTDHDFSQGFSCQGWFKVDELLAQDNDWRPLFDFGDGPRVKNLLLYYGWTDRTDINLRVGSSRLPGKGVLVPGTWINVACTIHNGLGTMYIDGIPVGQAEIAELESGPRARGYIGGSTWDSTPHKGAVTSLHIWNRELRVDEIRQFMFTPPDPDASGLLHYWPGTTAAVGNAATVSVEDLGAGRAHGTMTGTTKSQFLLKKLANPITTIGNRTGGGAPFGRVGEYRQWSAALTPAEIRTHSLLTLSGSEPDLTAYYPLDDIVGAQAEAADRTGNHRPATIGDAPPVARTARIGSPNPAVVAFDGQRTLSVEGIELRNRSFTVEYWLKRFDAGERDWQIGLGSANPGAGLHIGFRENNALAFDFWNNTLDVTSLGDTTNRWLHIAAVYDAEAKTQSLYVDGKRVGRRGNVSPLAGHGPLNVGGLGYYQAWTTGQMAEVRVWDHARAPAEIRSLRRRRASGDEPGLLVCLPLDGPDLVNRVPGKAPAAANEPLSFLRTDDLPIAPAGSLVTAEYSTVGADPAVEGAKRAILRRFYGFVDHGGQGRLLSDKRIEELTLQWIGNAQFEPTLLGYMEGAPPVPSENLTINYDYDGATSVELIQSDEMSYSWNRNRDVGGGLDTNFFLGAGWSTSGGAFIESQISEGHVGARGSTNTQWRRTESSTIRANSTEEQRDRLDLRGTYETDPRFPHLGNRFVPKNVGYALVISGMADVFITKMKRTGRMVAYEVLPTEDVPPDINTITFVMNPSYTLNGSLDGLVGSHAADPRFYEHVPAMRAQYGSRYPASYFNLKQAYDLKSQIDRWDQQRESFFVNFDARETGLSDALLEQVPGDDDANSFGQITVDDGSADAEGEEPKVSKADARKETTAAYKRRSERGSGAAKERRKEIDQRFADQDKQLEAAEAFVAWQRRMEGLQVRAAKRNIVNTYVWDADGGMRFEEQSFANTIEHTLGGSFSLNASLGLDTNITVAGFKFELQAMGTLEMSQSMTKTASATRSFDLNVRLDGIERKGVTDADDYPVLPGEKVDRYRFMSFYLEGDTDHFTDFFAYVVDPEWLLSNDEEARALRQVARGRPNKTWRVMHRVTYVERPALLGFGKDRRQTDELAQSSQEVFNYFDAIEQGNDQVHVRIDELAEQLDKLTATLAEVKEQTAKIGADDPPSVPQAPDDSNGAVPTADIIALEAETAPAMLDVNTATLDELVAVKGIGAVVAQRVIDLRSSRGGFSSLDELVEVDGISAATVIGSEPLLYVDDGRAPDDGELDDAQGTVNGDRPADIDLRDPADDAAGSSA